MSQNPYESPKDVSDSPIQIAAIPLKAFAVWAVVAIGLFLLVLAQFPLRTDVRILLFWLTQTMFLAWLAGGFGALFGRPIVVGVIGGIVGFAFSILSVQ